MQEKSFSKIKKQNPVSIIVHGTNTLGENLAKILLEQGSKVILIDKFDAKSKKLILELKKIGEADFVDIEGLEDLMKNIGRVDYLFYLQSEFLLNNESFTSKDFLEESNNLNLCLKVAQKYNAKISLLTSVHLNERLAQDPNTNQPSTYSAEELQKYSETLTAEYHDKSKINARILRIGAILGKENNIDRFPKLNQLFEDSVKNSAINITGEGLYIHYLIDLSDLLYGILKLTFSSLTNGEVISLCNNNEYTTLSIAYKLLELNPNATEIKFLPNTEKRPVLHNQYVPAPNAQEYDWKQRKSLERSISDTLEAKYLEYNKKWEKQPLTEDSYKERLEEIRRKKTTKINRRGNSDLVATPMGEAFSKAFSPFKKISFKEFLSPKKIGKNVLLTLGLLLIFYFLLYPAISIGAGTFGVYRSSKNLTENISDFKNPDIEKDLKSINKNFKHIAKSFEQLHWLFSLTQKSEMYDEVSLLLHGLDTGSEGLITLAEGTQPLTTYMSEFEPALGFQEDLPTTTREYSNLLKDLEKNSDQISESAHKISEALKIAKNIDKELYPKSFQPKLEEIQEMAKEIEKQIEPIPHIIKFLPESLGINGRKRYLVLLQNPGELRSTGGWISSYALVGIEGGQIRELVVDDVYNLDGELKNQGKVFAPPLEMGKYLEVKNVGLSLANWDPSFPEVAKNSEFFVKEAGKAHKVDGVFTIDIYLLQDLLDQWGGIYIPGESDLITSENLHEKIFSLHESFTPGESQKATFLTKLADEVLRKVFSSGFADNKDVFSVLVNALESKNMLLYLDNMQAQQYFSEKGWAGEISSSKHLFYPFSVEWNWGANKANLYLEREQRIKAEIKNINEIKYNYSLILKNNSTSKTYPQGEYKNYLRVYIPQDAEILSTDGFKDDKYTTHYEKGFKVLAGWFNVPVSTTKELQIEYSLDSAESLFTTEGNSIFLNSTLFKQPGTSRNDSARIEIVYPNNWLLIDQGNFDKARIQLIQQVKLDSEKNFMLEWSFL